MMVSPQNNLKTQADLCKEIAQSIGDKFDPYAFLEKYPRVPSLIRVVILKDIIAAAPGLSNVWKYAEKIIRQAVRAEVLENGNQAESLKQPKDVFKQSPAAESLKDPTRSPDPLGFDNKPEKPPVPLVGVPKKEDPCPEPLPSQGGKTEESQLPTQNDPTLPIPGGYILLARKLLTSGVMVSPPLVLKLWVWMLLQTTYKGYGKLKRGQFFSRLKDIQKAMAHKVGFRLVKPTIKEIRGSMKILMKGHMMGTMKVSHGMVITICNYDYYQNPKNYEGHNEGQRQGHTEGTILTRKDKERKKNTYVQNPGFKAFYETYPKHEGNKKALDAWQKLNFDNGQIEIILAAIEKQKKHKELLRAKGQFCPEWPMPATWLNGRRWEDEIQEVKPSW